MIKHKSRINRLVLGWSLLIPGILFTSYFFFGLSLGWGVYFGMLFLLILGIFLAIAGIIKILVKESVLGSKFKTVRRLFRISAAGALLSFMIVEGLIIYNANCVDSGKADYILILGAALIGDQPSLELQYRLDKALEYINKYPDSRIIVSGGKGKDETLTEASAMQQYLSEHGIDNNRITKEEKSTSTLENIKFSMELIKKTENRQNIELLLVTNDFHEFRAKLLAKRQGFIPYGLPARTPLYIIPNHYIREYFAVIKSIIFDQ